MFAVPNATIFVYVRLLELIVIMYTYLLLYKTVLCNKLFHMQDISKYARDTENNLFFNYGFILYKII